MSFGVISPTFVLMWIIVTCATMVYSKSFEEDTRMTLSEKQKLDRFKLNVTPLLKEDFMKSDIYLIRWLRLTNFDLNAAESKLKENLRWRVSNKMDIIHKENFADFFNEFPATVDTYDLEHKPIATIDIWDWDIREAVISGRAPRLLRYLDMLMDNVTLQVFEAQRKGYNVTQWKALANTDNFNMINHGCPICIPVWIQFLTSLENHFPGWLDELIIIESSGAVSTVLEIVKPFLSRQTRESIKILGQNRNIWMRYLDARISKSERRLNYGGTKPNVNRS